MSISDLKEYKVYVERKISILKEEYEKERETIELLVSYGEATFTRIAELDSELTNFECYDNFLRTGFLSKSDKNLIFFRVSHHNHYFELTFLLQIIDEVDIRHMNFIINYSDTTVLLYFLDKLSKQENAIETLNAKMVFPLHDCKDKNEKLEIIEIQKINTENL